jgi:hypothetical protein
LVGDVLNDLKLPTVDMPYVVSNSTVTVDAGSTLTLPAGTVLKFQGATAQLVVNGTLQGQGTAQSPVTLTSVNDNNLGGNTGTGTPAPEDWHGLVANGGGTVNLVYSTLSYAGSTAQGGIYNNGASVVLTNSALSSTGGFGLRQTGTSASTTLSASTISGFLDVVHFTTGYGVYADSGSLTISNSTFAPGASIAQGTVYDVFVSNASPSITGTTFNGGTFGVWASSPQALTFTANTFTTTGYPIFLSLPTAPLAGLTMSANTSSGGGMVGIGLSGNVSGALTLPLAGMPYVVDPTVTVNSGATLTLPPGQVVKFRGASSQLLVNGTLQSQGTVQNPVFLTSFKDDVGGSTSNDGNATVAAANDWAGVQVTAGGTLNLAYTTLQYAGAGGQAGINNNGGLVTVANSTLRANGTYGLYQAAGSTSIHNSNIVGHTLYGVYNAVTTVVLDATNNWWGDASGPAPFGAGNGINSSGCPQSCVYYVNAKPWLLSSVGTAPSLSLQLSAPATLSLAGDQYSPNPFNVVATVANIGAATASNVSLSLSLPGGLSLSQGTFSQTVGDIPAGQQVQATWSVHASGETALTTLNYFVAASASNAASMAALDQITLPGGGLTVSSISTNVGGNTGAVTATIVGGGFTPDATVALVSAGQPAIIGAIVTVSSDGTSMTATFDLSGRQLGRWDVNVTLGGGSSANLPQAFTIIPGVGPNLSAHIVGRNLIRLGSKETFFITVTNNGNIDSGPQLIALNIPATFQYSQESGSDLFAVGTSTDPKFGIATSGTKNLMYAAANVPAGKSVTAPLQLTVPSGAGAPPFQINPVVRQDIYPANFDVYLTQSGLVFIPYNPQCPGAINFYTNELLAHSTALQSYIALIGALDTLNSLEASALSSVGVAVALASLALPIFGLAPATVAALGAFTSIGQFVLDHFVDNPTQTDLFSLSGAAAQALAAVKADPLLHSRLALPLIGVLTSVVSLAAQWPQIAAALATADADYRQFQADLQSYVAARNAYLTALASLGPACNVTLPAPTPPGNPFSITPVSSLDPNVKVGPLGFGPQHYVATAPAVPYSVFFTNEGTATAAAQTVVITDQLDSSLLDMNTFELGTIVIGTTEVSPPHGLSQYSADVDLRPATNLIVRVNASLDKSSGLVTWRFLSLDPANMLPTTDPLAGFLPPDITPPQGEGSVLFSISPKVGLTTGTEIHNVASIVFDLNAPIVSDGWLNTIDSTPPTSRMIPLPTAEPNSSFQLQWSGNDVGTGIHDFTIYVSQDGGPFTIWQADTTSTSSTYTGQPGHTYGFYSIAVDEVGNVESAKSVAEATTVVSGATPLVPGPIQNLPAPVRLIDTRTLGSGPIAAGNSRCFTVAGVGGIPSDAGAIVLNVTGVGYNVNGWLTVYPNGQSVPATSTLNFDLHEYATANGAVMRIGSGGQVCVNVGTVGSASGSAHVILDATGYLTAPDLVKLPMLSSPQRVADTRSGGGQVNTGQSRCFGVAGVAGVPANAAAVTLNVTAVGYRARGWLSAYPAGESVPATSTVNFDTTEYAVANGAVVRVGSNGQVCVNVGTVGSAPGASDIVLDVTGYLTADGLAQMPMLTSPQRVVDTRTSGSGGPVPSGQARCFTIAGVAGVPSNAMAVVVNITAVGYDRQGWLTAYPAGASVPPTSTLNFDTSQYAVANGAVIALGTGGQLCVSVGTVNSVAGSSHIIIDVVGFIPAPIGP